MIDIKLLQNDFERVSGLLAKKKVDADLLEDLKLKLSATKLKRQQMESLQAEQNTLSSQFGAYKKEGKDITSLKEKIDALKENRTLLEAEVQNEEKELEAVLLAIPNIPNEDVPYGASEDENIILEKILTPKEFSFTPKEHWEIGENLGIIDFERGVKLAKSRFSALSGIGARLERALINYFLDFNRERGFAEWYVPFMANTNTLIGTGQLPKFEEDLFKIEGEDLYLIPTAEVQLTNLFNDEILTAEELPLLLTSYTPCFRKDINTKRVFIYTKRALGNR
jgi:seryl-tRNA synthetase